MLAQGRHFSSLTDHQSMQQASCSTSHSPQISVGSSNQHKKSSTHGFMKVTGFHKVLLAAATNTKKA